MSSWTGPKVTQRANSPTDFDRLKSTISKWAGREQQTGELWVVLIGHGTFDGRTAKFNMKGKDVAAKELVAWFATAKRPLVIAPDKPRSVVLSASADAGAGGPAL